MANERAGWKKQGPGWKLSEDGEHMVVMPRGEADCGLDVTIAFGSDMRGASYWLSTAQWRAMCALPVVPAETPAIADGTSQPWTPPAPAASGGILVNWLDGRDKPAPDTTAVIDGLHARVSALLLERDEARKVGAEALTRATAAEAERDRLTFRVAELEQELAWAERFDRRFELVKAAMAVGRDGYTAVRDADEALQAMGGTKGGGL